MKEKTYAIIIAYHQGQAIAMDDNGDVFAYSIPEEFVVVGEAMEVSESDRIDTLSPFEQSEIREVINAIPQDVLEDLLEG